jgi:Pyruvate/2-oxoacid:ferredoxin oxidoreductase gamma subunit
VATAALAALLEDSGIFPSEAFAAAIESFKSAEIASVNLTAVRAGVELVRNAG